MKIGTFLKNWTLIIAIGTGIAGYFVYAAMPALDSTRPLAHRTVAVVQPVLIFVMLFIAFSQVDPRRWRFHRWHAWLLLIQCGLFSGIGCILMALPHSPLRVVLEGAMICLICPTATAGSVITKKLGGDVDGIVAYTLLINLAAALLVPAFVPLVHPVPGLTVWRASALILGKVSPLLLLPLAAALAVRYACPPLNRQIRAHQEVSFYLWAVALALATAVTTRSIVHSDVGVSTQCWLVAVSLVCCGLQFWIGRIVGSASRNSITAGQSLGQKNTVLAIWMGYTFFTPITAVVGGFYSIWHNVVNSYQLYLHRKGGGGEVRPSDSPANSSAEGEPSSCEAINTRTA